VVAVVDKVLGSGLHPQLTWPEISDVAPALLALYAEERDGLFWFTGEAPHPGLSGAVAGLARADEHGLSRADYDAEPLGRRWAALQAGTERAPAERALFDLGLTVSLARLLSAVHAGRVDPATLSWGYEGARKRVDLGPALRTLREGGGVAQMLALLEPPFPHYARARRALRAYRQAEAAGEPPPVPDLPKGRRKVEPGQPWADAPRLAARLRVLGDLLAPEGEAVAPIYEEPLVGAVKAFQARHGLEADGVIGPGTLKAANVGLARRAVQIALAMERMRWLPKLGDRPNVFVNVALFRLWATDPATGEEPLRMKVVVGKSLNHKTPMFLERMEYVIFRPYWNPPYGITVKEIVPRARREPAYLAREDLEIVASGDEGAPALPATPQNLDKVVAGTLFVRQRPGPQNSLGLAKFIFPNDENVYMHGTPAQSLFARVRRDFSHGCIRLEDPTRFAEWVLRDQPEWTRERILRAMQADRPTRVNLKAPLDVVLFYDTVHVNSEGVVFLVDDIYGHDRRLEAALEQGYPYPTRG
jgi:murein L,D-transpeptidase YcbB/YkuD